MNQKGLLSGDLSSFMFAFNRIQPYCQAGRARPSHGVSEPRPVYVNSSHIRVLTGIALHVSRLHDFSP